MQKCSSINFLQLEKVERFKIDVTTKGFTPEEVKGRYVHKMGVLKQI